MVRIAPLQPEPIDRPTSTQAPPNTGSVAGSRSDTPLDGKEQLASILSVLRPDTPGSHVLFGLMGRTFTVGGLRSMREYLLEDIPE